MEKEPFNIQGGTSSASFFSQEQQQQQHFQTAPSSLSFLPDGISQNPGLYSHITSQTNTFPVVPGLSYANFFAELLHYVWQRPEDNSLEFWGKYAAKFYDPNFVCCTCVSKCKNIHGSPVAKWQCLLCESVPTLGYKVRFERLPINLKHRFDHFMTCERYNMMWSSENKYSAPGLTTLVCEKATHSITLAQGNLAICEGVLRVTITDQLKILTWEFCNRRQEEYVSLSSLPNIVQNQYRMANEAGQSQKEEE